MGPLELLIVLLILAVLLTPVLLLMRVLQSRGDRKRRERHDE
jgi:hypothetical protein